MANDPQGPLNPFCCCQGIRPMCVIHPVSSLHYSSSPLARKLAVCTRGTLLVSLLPDLFIYLFLTSQTSSLMILVFSKSILNPEVDQKWWFWTSVPLLGLNGPRRWACLSSPPLPSPPFVPHSHFLQEDALPSWSRQAQLCFGSIVARAHWVGEGTCLSLFLEIICLSTSLTVTITRAVCCVSQQKDTCCWKMYSTN